ncbi:hypothetical protein MTO96_020844 [Rhipicephalus appendiculatus]
MFAQVLTRCLQTCASLRAVEKTALMELRKKTGYTFSNCKKALEATDNDIKKAEKWLADEAKKHGWAKSAQMQGRQTKQGLIAINVDGPFAALAEVNCETDFVARTPEFQKFVEQLVRIMYQPRQEVAFPGDRYHESAAGHQGAGEVADQRWPHGGGGSGTGRWQVGRAAGRSASPVSSGEAGTTLLAGYCHPQTNNGESKKYPCFGRYGALVAYRDLGDSPLSEEEMEELGRHLCQQVVALNPKSIGLLDDYLQAAEDSTAAPEEEEQEEQPHAEEEEEDESRLLFQDYVVDPNIKVGRLVSESRIDIMDFERFACGESTEKNE